MIKPERMSLVRLLFFKEDLNEVSKFLMESGIVEIEKASNFIQRKDKLEEINMSKLISDSNNLLKELNDLSKNLDIRMCVPKKLILSPIFNINTEIGREFQELKNKVNSLLNETNLLEDEIYRLELKVHIFSLIEDMGFSLNRLRNLPHIFLKIGLVPLRGLGSLKAFLKVSSNVDLKILGYHRNEAIILIFTLKENEEKLKSILQTIGFNEVNLEGDEDKSISNLIEELELLSWERRENLAKVRKNIREIGEKEAERICYWIWLLEYNLKLFSAMNFFLETKLGYIVTVWVPTKEVRKIKKGLNKRLGEKFEFIEEKADELIKKGLPYQDIPSYVKYPIFLKPFAKITSIYGHPAYLHVDPTIFLALSFVLMFGVMFADVGHGIILFLVGIIPFLIKPLKKLREFGSIILSCGIFSTFFGFLFGSFFGKENILSAIWFKPMEEPMKFLGLGIGIGIAMITLGIILNILQRFWQKDKKDILFSSWGILTLSFYWLVLYFIVSAMRYKYLNLGILPIAGILSLPLIVSTFGDIILTRREKEDISEAIFKPIEIMLGLLTNTISYVRVAAFGLTHIALMTSVYTVANMMAKIPSFKESLIIEGNVGVILLEGLIVFIQCLRLEFYEFFSKFFTLQGREFKPLKL